MTLRTLVITALLASGAFAADHAMLPNPKLTPGATDPHVTQATIQQTICKSGYTATVRDVSEATKKEVMQRYGLPESDLHLVEIDHFISLEIGGANDPNNLWPQYYNPAKGQKNYLGAREKDKLETHEKRLVCSGAISLLDAQKEVRSDWVAAYRKYALDKGSASRK